jgi:sec-independent protein translocase protein TatC
MDEVNGGELSADQPRGFPNDARKIAMPAASARRAGGRGSTNPPPPQDDEERMLRMSFLEHLQELRARIIKALCGFGIVFALCAICSNQLFDIVLAPGLIALKNTGIPGAKFIAIDVMEQFSIEWVWTPFVASLFLSAPWIFWQLWSFIAPGLYEREKKWAMPFVVCTAGLFIAGGLFGYFIAFPYGMTFLFGVSRSSPVVPEITIDNYFAKFVDVMLGVGVVFELPILVFFLVLIRVASPAFLLKHTRYAILVIFIIAAVVTPTSDVFNLMLFAFPMCLLFFLGIFASYLLVLKRESRKFPWKDFLKWLAAVVLALAICGAVAVLKFHFRLTWHWPFLLQ